MMLSESSYPQGTGQCPVFQCTVMGDTEWLAGSLEDGTVTQTAVCLHSAVKDIQCIAGVVTIALVAMDELQSKGVQHCSAVC